MKLMRGSVKGNHILCRICLKTLFRRQRTASCLQALHFCFSTELLKPEASDKTCKENLLVLRVDIQPHIYIPVDTLLTAMTLLYRA